MRMLLISTVAAMTLLSGPCFAQSSSSATASPQNTLATAEKLKHDERWTYYDDPELPDLIELRRILWNKYQRKHLAYEDVAAVEKLIRDRGGSWEETDQPGDAESDS